MVKFRFSKPWLRHIAFGAAMVLSAPAALAQGRSEIVVASKADTEGALLGSMIALVLERSGIPMRTLLQLGPTQKVRAALLSGEIDIYPEYTGNGAFFHGQEGDAVWKAPGSAYETVKRLDWEQHRLVWLDRAPANNTWLIAVRGDLARRHNLDTMADFAGAVKRSLEIRLAASEEFVQSPAALPSFEEAYDFQFPRDRIAVQPGGSTATTMRAAAQNLGGVNAAMAYGTDGAIATLDLVVMRDTRGAQIVYEPAPVVRAEIMQRHPALAKALGDVFASLTTAKLQTLNAEIAVEGKPAREVAARYLDDLAKRR